MADLTNLDYQSISEMSTDEAIEMLRQIRLSRRIPSTPPKSVIKKKASKAIPVLDADQAAEILKLIGGN
jgi:hypothetical protein